MRPTGKVADKLIFVGIYVAVAIFVVIGAGRLVNYSADFKFYRDFLIPWEMRLLEMQYKSVQWPSFKKEHPVAYMQSVAELMTSTGLPLPRSNTRHAFIYRLNRFGGETTKILVVFHHNKLIIYGLPDTTFKRLDQFVDGQADSVSGDFTGEVSEDSITMIGSWKL